MREVAFRNCGSSYGARIGFQALYTNPLVPYLVPVIQPFAFGTSSSTPAIDPMQAVANGLCEAAQLCSAQSCL
jgi:hypothetical protein